MYEPTTDDIYAYALSKTLTKVSSPATVGLYSTCQNRINMILRQLEVNMPQVASRMEKEYKGKSRPRSVDASFCGFLALIGRLLFYKPIWTKENQHYHNVRFIYVHFSAWHFAGSDLLWAGIAIRLFQAMQMSIGKLQLVLYRVVQFDEEQEVKKKVIMDGPNNWRSKKVCCCPLWFLFLFILLVAVVILVGLLTLDIPQPEMNSSQEVNGTQHKVGVLQGLIFTALGLPAISGIRFVLMMAKNLIFNPDVNIRRGMDNERVSSQLGFMNEVRKEMWFLSCFIKFMEVFERRRIRVVLKITNLDRCSPKKIVAVLDAINILLSDDESPFISILAVDPSVLIQKVNFADGCFTKEDRAHALLNRIVTLSFTVPPLCDDSRLCMFHSLNTYSSGMGGNRVAKRLKNTYSSDESLVEMALEMYELNPLIAKTSAALDAKDEEVEKWIWSILTSNENNLNKYLLDDSVFMRRVINSIRMTVIILTALKIELPEPHHVAAWVVLTNEWPCRLSWVIQCVEDAQQRADIDEGPRSDDLKTLWTVFSESKAELYVMSPQIEDLLEQDGDPEMFERFLKIDFQFTIKDLKTFQAATVNLDCTIRKELAQIRGMSRLNDSGWMRDLAPLPVTTIIKMNPEDVCTELERMKYPSKYADIVRSNGLNGPALIFGDTDDLKKLLGMTFGEWATFRLHFLGSLPHLQRQYKKSPFQHQLSKFLPHVAHQYSSNLMVADECM